MAKIFLALLILILAGLANAQESVTTTTDADSTRSNLNKTGDVGIGVILGTPTAFNIKFWNAETLATNLNLSMASGDLAIMADALWHFRRTYSDDPAVDRPAVFAPYIGVGLMAVFDTTSDSRQDRPLYKRTNNEDGVGLGGRVPIGLEFLPEAQRFGIFAELAPGAILSPTYFSFFQAGVGGRYYF